MSTPARQALDRQATPWLFASALVTIAPHVLHQAYWLSALAGLLMFWAIRLWWKDERLPGRWVLFLLVIVGCSGILIEFRSLFGRDAGVAMLVVFMAMKLLELKSQRDAVVVVVLGYFLLLTHYFYSQSIPTGLWLLFALWLVTATLIRLHGGPASTTRASLRYAASLCLQAIPFMLVLYLLFPRISGPLWGLPSDAHAGMTGLSDTMSPGSISRLAQSADIAFRARFSTTPPAKQKLYWRGPVMEQFDGTTWRLHDNRGTSPQLETLSAPFRYVMTLEPHNQRWILALDAPVQLPEGLNASNVLAVTQRLPVTERRRYELAASLDYRFNVAEDPRALSRNLALPPGVNPQARALAERWRNSDHRPSAIIGQAQALFAAEFTYTLQPPLLGQNGIDEFLFKTRRGFCEHYAGAFVFLMRAAGIPARVVSGYQGGEFNPLDGYLVIRQSDAHAWAEVWLEGQGWVRVDPTASVSPTRIETGIADALPFGEPLPALVQWRADWLRTLRYRWEAVNNAWNQHILGYDPQRQRELLSRLGLPDTEWRSLATVLGIACSLLVAAMTAWTLYQRPAIDPARRLWLTALSQLARRQVDCAPWETPMAVAQRVREQRPELAETFQNVVDAYLQARYGKSNNNLNALREAVARLR
ncbi:transglutaminase TgpA family protein [Pseudomonas fluvialis]|uniref:transglutaminase TgpA family protein n=1 Tax=Pseudomonas fluvialis TaxID=1793966 RepID=UPI0035B1E14E